MGKIQNTFSAIGKSWKSKPTSKKIYAYLWMLTGVVLAVLIGMFVGLSKTSAVKDETNAKWQIADKPVQAKELKFVDKNNNNQFDAGDTLTVDGKEVSALVVKDGASIKRVDVASLQASDVQQAQDIYKNHYSTSTPSLVETKELNKIKLVASSVEFNSNPAFQTTSWDAVNSKPKTNSDYKFVNPDLVAPYVTNNTSAVNANYDPNLTSVLFKDGSFAVLNSYWTYDYAKTEHGAAIWGNDAKGTLPLTAKATMQQNALAAIGGLFAVSITAAIFTTAGVEYASKKKKTGGKK